MLKKSLIIISIFLYLGILTTGSPFKIDISSYGNNPFFSLYNVNQFVYAQQGGSDKSSDGGSDKSSDGGSDKSSDGGSDKSSDGGSDKSSDGGSDKSSDGGSDKSSDGGSDKSSDGGSDQSEFASNDENKENSEKNAPDFLSRPEGSTTVDLPVEGDNPSTPVEGDNPSTPVEGDNPSTPVEGDNPSTPVEGDNPSTPVEGDNPSTPVEGDNPSTPVEGDNPSTPVEGDNPSTPVEGDNPSTPVEGDNPSTPVEGDNPSTPVEGDNSEPSKDKNNIKDKINFEFKKITKIISKTKTKVIVEDDSHSEKEIIIVSDPTCPTQSETVELNGMIDPKGIRLLANFYPCIIQNGGITMNIPESPYLNLAVIYIDNNIDNHARTLISPSKIQSLDKNQGLFSIELDKKMKGNDPITGELTTLEKINGLALYNSGNEPIEFKEGSSVALTATFTK